MEGNAERRKQGREKKGAQKLGSTDGERYERRKMEAWTGEARSTEKWKHV
jgi:hypothetical protein